MQTGQVLQEVQTGAAMHLWQMELHVHFPVLPENDKTCRQGIIVKERKFLPVGRCGPGKARAIIELVIFAEAAAIQELIDGPAAGAAEMLVTQPKIAGGTVVAAMGTGDLRAGGRDHNKGKVFPIPRRAHDDYHSADCSSSERPET